MNKFVILTRRNLRGGRGQHLSFTLVVMIAAFILSIGLISLLNFGKLFDLKYDETNSFDFFYTLSSKDWTDEMKDWAKEIEGVTLVETRKSIIMQGNGEFSGGKISLNHVFFDMEEPHTINTLKPVGETLPLESVEHPIYISYWIAASGGKLGDTYRFVGKTNTYEFTIAGFVDDLMYGNNNCGNLGVYLPGDEFDDYYKVSLDTERAITISGKLKERNDSKEAFTAFANKIAGKITQQYENGYGSYEISRQNRTMTTNVVAEVLIVFSILLVAITMLVIRFRVKNSIIEELQNMGVLKAMGYTSSQVIISVAVPYLLLSIVAVLGGIVLSYLVFPVVEQAFEMLAGLYWHQKFDWKEAGLVALIIPVIFLCTILSAGKIRKLHPIEALHSGVRHHNFKRNFIPLHRGQMGVHMGLAAKNMVNAIGQNLFLLIVLIMMTFTAIYAGSGTYNSVMAPERFMNAMSEENPTLVLQGADHSQAAELRGKVDGMDQVKKTLFYEEMMLTVKDSAVKTVVTEDFGVLDNNLCYEGRYPIHDNEVVIGSQTAGDTGLQIGDMVTITLDEIKKDYLVTGFVQAMNHTGEICAMTTQGMDRIKPDYQPLQFYVYLESADNAAVFLEKVRDKYGELVAGYLNYQEMIDKVYGNFMPMITMMIGSISIVAIMIITAVLYMITRTILLQKRQEFGILKAAGFTTSQLMWQQAFGMLPFIVAGCVTGGILGKCFVNQIWLVCLGFTGIKKVDLGIPSSWAVCIVLLLSAFTFLISALMAGKVRTVSAMELIRE